MEGFCGQALGLGVGGADTKGLPSATLGGLGPEEPQDSGTGLQQAAGQTVKHLLVHTAPKDGLVLIWHIELRRENRRNSHKPTPQPSTRSSPGLVPDTWDAHGVVHTDNEIFTVMDVRDQIATLPWAVTVSTGCQVEQKVRSFKPQHTPSITFN